MWRAHLTPAAAVLATAAAIAVPSASWGAQDSATSFVVNTQFRSGPSPVVAATGPLSTCTTVTENEGAQAIPTGPRSLLFVGTKTLACANGTVTIAYQATINTASGRKTFGTWSVVDSTVPGVAFGGGRLTGDSARCQVLAGSDGCILDTFTGRVGG
jgi:hypothetical protein